MERQQHRSYTVATAEQVAQRAEHSLVTVEVLMPHVERYGHPVLRTLVYGASFPVRIGQQVLCPPTRLSRGWTRGRVVAVDDPGGYAGRVKYVAPLGGRR